MDTGVPVHTHVHIQRKPRHPRDIAASVARCRHQMAQVYTQTLQNHDHVDVSVDVSLQMLCCLLSVNLRFVSLLSVRVTPPLNQSLIPLPLSLSVLLTNRTAPTNNHEDIQGSYLLLSVLCRTICVAKSLKLSFHLPSSRPSGSGTQGRSNK